MALEFIYETSTWFRIGEQPAEIIEKLNKEINAGLADPTTYHVTGPAPRCNGRASPRPCTSESCLEA
jgi:hypothetical protein